MRTLFVLRGAPGAGKSTLIRRHGLGDLAIGLDDFRRLYSTPFTDLDGRPTLSMAFGAEKQVVSAFKAAVATRIRQGGTLLLDCTNPTRKSYREFASLARRCGYAVYVIDIQGELSDAELIERNETRRGGIDYVGPEVVASIAARVRAGTASVVEPVVGLDDVRRLNTITEIDVAERYERLVVIGDVQSCAGALAKVKEHFGGWDPATLFVFVGDLFDRGPDAAGVLDLIADQADADGGLPDNIILVEGNHDEHLRMLCADVRGGSWPDTRESRRQILASGRRNGDIEALLARMVPMVGLRFAGEHILVTHAGLDPVTIDRIVTEREDGLLSWDLTEVPMLQLLLGSSERSTAFQGRSSYERAVELRLSHPRILQVHGHRNGTRSEEPGPAHAAPNVYTLEHRVEHGGHLAVLQIDADGTRTLHAFEEDPPALTGAAAGPPRVGPAGDSPVAQNPIPTLRLPHESRDWDITVYLKGACSFGPPEYSKDRCREHNEAVLEQIEKNPPDVVVLQTTETSDDSSVELLRPGIRRLVEQLTDQGITVIGFRDNPRSDQSLYECANAVGPRTLVGGCLFPQAGAMAVEDPAKSLEEIPLFHQIDASDMLCPDGVCGTIIGDVFVYMDDNHVSATYSRTMAPELASRVERVMGIEE